mgnify:CR=1 FL=1
MLCSYIYMCSSWTGRRRAPPIDAHVVHMSRVNLCFADDGEAMSPVAPSCAFLAQMASSLQTSIHPPTVVTADYVKPVDFDTLMVPWNDAMVAEVGFSPWCQTDKYDSKTRCIALLHDKSLCLELEQRVRAKIKGDKLDLSEKGAQPGARVVKGGWLEQYQNVPRMNAALQEQSVFCIWKKEDLMAFQKSVDQMHILVEDLMKKASATPVMQELLGDHSKIILEQANIFLGIGNGSEAFGYHRDDEDNTKSAGSEQAVPAVLTTVTMLSVAAGTMHVAGAENEFEYEVAKTSMFHPSLFHRSGIVYPGTMKLACHWGIKKLSKPRSPAANPKPPAVKQEHSSLPLLPVTSSKRKVDWVAEVRDQVDLIDSD